MVTHQVSGGDRGRAEARPEINHWVVGCGAIAQFNGGENFFNKKTGSLSSLCSSIN